MGEDFGRAFVSFFAIIDPLGNAVVFHLFTRDLPYDRKVLVAVVSILAAAALLILFSLAGQEVLEFLGISEDSFKVAAGLLLLLPAYRLVEHGQPMDAGDRAGADPLQVALVPLATPLLAGPGALAAAISFSDSFGVGVTVGALNAVLAGCFLLFIAAERLLHLLGPSFMRVVARLVGILLFAIAIDFILEGADAFFNH